MCLSPGIMELWKIKYQKNYFIIEDVIMNKTELVCQENICEWNIASLSDSMKWAFEYISDNEWVEAERIGATKVEYRKETFDVKIFVDEENLSEEYNYIIFPDYWDEHV